MNIFLDDIRPCPDNFVCARDFNDFVRIVSLNKEQLNIVSLDYDLDSMKTGLDAAKFLIENDIIPNKIILHSESDFGVRRIYKYLSSNCEINIESLRIDIFDLKKEE